MWKAIFKAIGWYAKHREEVKATAKLTKDLIEDIKDKRDAGQTEGSDTK